MRSDLGRLDAIAQILQVGPPVVAGGTLGVAAIAVICCGQNLRSIRMKIFRAAALIALSTVALLSVPAYAQTPNINLLPEFQSKTPEEKEADAIKERAYRDSLRKIPDAKVSNDPWGTVRSTEPPKTTQAKPKTKTGSTAN
jgi:hypothetical protein